MNFKKIFFASTFIFLNVYFANAQIKEAAKKDSASTKTSVNVMVFNPSMTKNYFSNRYVDSTKNAIKINPLLIARGVVPVYFERKIAKRFSLQAAVGMTFTDFLYEFTKGDIYPPNGITVIGKTGYSLEGSFRYYLESHSQAIDGYYVSPDIWYRTYNKKMAVEDASGTPTGNFYNDSRDVLSFQLLVGSQNVGDNELFFDWYIGVGIAKTMLNSVQYGFISTAYGGANSTSITPSQAWNPIFSLGVNIGFGF